MSPSGLRTRFAPSPTGDLHLGGALCALASYWIARRLGGVFVLRIEDLDTPRVVSGSAERILEDLGWLGMDWDEGPIGGVDRGPYGPYSQSRRGPQYDSAIALLKNRGLVYPCDCSRAEIARVASAPHAGEEVVYPGTCRDKDPFRAFKRPPALRAKVPIKKAISFEDTVTGAFTQVLERDVGDFVLRRGDGLYAYQLAVVVDDLAMRITEVVRGADLLASTPRQIWLAEELLAAGFNGGQVPRYAHVPLVLDHEGNRLAKRSPGAQIRALREAGLRAEEVVGVIAHALGIVPSHAPMAIETATRSPAAALRPETLQVPHAWVFARSS